MLPRIEVVMPMAGFGRRFADAGFTTPKPFLPVLGEPMFVHALRSLDAIRAELPVTFVVRRSDDPRHDGDLDELRRARPGARILELDAPTRGAAETALVAALGLDPGLPLLLLDSDIVFESPAFASAVVRDDDTAADGILLTFRSREPRFSFVETDEHGAVVRTAEKDPISDRAIAGAYFFRRVGDFVDAARRLLARETPGAGEYYTSLVYNEMLTRNARIVAVDGVFHSLGTPEELERYLAQVSTARGTG